MKNDVDYRPIQKINLGLPWDWLGVECPFCGETSDHPEICSECGEVI